MIALRIPADAGVTYAAVSSLSERAG